MPLPVLLGNSEDCNRQEMELFAKIKFLNHWTLKWPLSYPLLFKANETFIVVALQLLGPFADQGVELRVGWPRLEQVDEALQRRRPSTQRRRLLLLQVVTLLLGEVDENLDE